MSQPLRRILGAAAITLTLGAVPLAAGRDFSLGEATLGEATGQQLKGTPAHAINRSAKADRPIGAPRASMAMQTISLQLSGLSATSVLVRMPLVPLSRSGSSVPSRTRPDGEKPAVACEPVVSTLTEVAKLLEPGRCVT